MSNITPLRPTGDGSPQVLIILQDNPETGDLDIGGVQRPSEHNPKSPAHIVGKWIAEHMDDIVRQAAAESRGQTINAPDVGESIIGPDRERTLLLPGTPL